MNFAPKLAKTLLSAAAIALVTTAAWAATLTVGGKNFTEQLIIAEITKQLLESKGHTVDKKDGMGTKIVRAALENGEVDLYWEYTGTSLITFNKVTERLSPEETLTASRNSTAKKASSGWRRPRRTTPTPMSSSRATPRRTAWRRSPTSPRRITTARMSSWAHGRISEASGRPDRFGGGLRLRDRARQCAANGPWSRL